MRRCRTFAPPCAQIGIHGQQHSIVVAAHFGERAVLFHLLWIGTRLQIGLYIREFGLEVTVGGGVALEVGHRQLMGEDFFNHSLDATAVQP